VGAVLSIEPGTIPVAVGPPAEEAARAARLPARFLDDDLPAPTLRPRTSPMMQNLLLALLGAVVLGLTSLALLVFLAG